VKKYLRLIGDKRANVTMTFGMCALIVFGAAGAALDLGRAKLAKSKLQASTDAAALAGAKADAANRVAVATSFFSANSPAGSSPTVTSDGEKVSVSASSMLETTLLKVIGFSALHIAVSSEALTRPAIIDNSATCILLLHPTDIGLYVNSDSKLQASCGLHINSSHSTEALFANSLSSVVTTRTAVNGHVRLNSSSTATPTPAEGAPIKADPLISLPAPSNALAVCNHTDFSVNAGESRVMSPGVYCKKTVINSGGSVYMLAGNYIFREGEFLVNSGGRVVGSGVMLYFADKDARLNVNSNSTINIVAPSAGTYQGVLMYQDRNENNRSAPPFIINSDSATRLQGTIYLPQGTLEVNSWSTANQLATYTAIIARKMVLNSNGTFKVNWDTTSSTPLPPAVARALAGVEARLTN
jgi:hypothetical protein